MIVVDSSLSQLQARQLSTKIIKHLRETMNQKARREKKETRSARTHTGKKKKEATRRA